VNLSTQRSSFFAAVVAWTVFAFPGVSAAQGLTTVSDAEWDQGAVRRVLRVFAYGGAATDAQVAAWAEMQPEEAIQEMLHFEPTNPLLSPVEDNTANHAGSLAELQALWSAAGPDNPTCADEIPDFRETNTQPDGDIVLRNQGLQNTWIAAVRARGLNPFRHRVGFWLVNYQMAVNLHDTEPPLLRDHYDRVLDALERHAPYHEMLGIGATTAAVAREYGHRSNIYNNNTGVFKGNDDFAREFHQLFFRINGVTEDPDYHENQTIEKTAWILTGMQIDKVPGAYGTNLASEWWVAPLEFSDHVDASGRNLRNLTRHYSGTPEILHQPIAGANAGEKLFALAAVAGQHQESLDNLPVYIVNFFADDNLTDAKVADLRAAWKAVAGQEDDFLHFLQAYATSTMFHSEETFKYFTAFDRNMLLYNLNTVDNVEHYGNAFTPRATMLLQGAEVFVPVHDVFGGQTSLNAANNPNLFKEAYNNSVNYPNRVSKYSEACRDTEGNTLSTWRKDWGKLVPQNAQGNYRVAETGEWLWRRFVGDGGSNFGPLERAHVNALLATGYDLGYLVDPDNPVVVYSAQDLRTEPFLSILTANEMTLLDLASTTNSLRRDANLRVGLAINFISMTPYMFGTGNQDELAVRKDSILWRNNSSGQNWLYEMDGPVVATSAGINTVAPTWDIAGTGDYDGDGSEDILWRNRVTGQNWMYRMDGSTILESGGINTVPLVWEIVGNGDYDGDGSSDILWRNSVTGQNWMYLMNGASIASSLGVNTVSNPDWQIVGSGDYNGDGSSDILWRNSVTGQNWMYLMNGASITSSLGVNTISNMSWQIVGDGDYNDDGNSDILLRNTSTGQNWMYLMNGASIASSLGVNTISNLDWAIVGDGDYDGDGFADILLRNMATGQNWMYLMNGNIIVTSTGINTVPDSNWEIVYRR
jgi:hypothetical protein